MAIFRRLRVGSENRGTANQVVFFTFFTHAATPPFAAHSSDTEPIFRSEILNRASVSRLPFPPLSRFRLSLGF